MINVLRVPAVLGCLLACRTGAAVLRPVDLPPRAGKVVGAAFSPDSRHLVIIRDQSIAESHHTLEIIGLASGDEQHADVLKDERLAISGSRHFIDYSPDGRYLVLATVGSDVLSIIDTASLRCLHEVSLHPVPDSRVSLSQGHRHFRGVISVTASSSANVFGVLSHDDELGNEIFICSFPSGQVVKTWEVGDFRVAGPLGFVSVALSADGSQLAVPIAPGENKALKVLNGVRIYDTGNGRSVRSFKTSDPVGRLALTSANTLFTTRLTVPGVFSRKACIERWDLKTVDVDGQFCDKGHNVFLPIAAAPGPGLLAGFASSVHRDMEGDVYSGSGWIDVWDIRSNALLASSTEIHPFVSFIRISANGEWVIADQNLFHLFAVSPTNGRARPDGARCCFLR